MLTATLENLNSVNGDNLGSICYFEYFPKEWLTAPLSIDRSTQQVTGAISLLPDKLPLRADCRYDSVEYAEKPKSSKSGPYMELNLVAEVNKDIPSTSALLLTLKYHELIIIYHDKNGFSKIIGDQDAGMRLSPELTVEKETEGKTFYELTFSMESEYPAPFYTP